jgi:hypothetical protein
MKELLEMIAKALVDHPEEVEVRSVEGQQVIVLELRVHPGRRRPGDWSAWAHSRSPPYDFQCRGHEAA